MKGPFPPTSPFGAIGKDGSPEAYLIDPGAGSAVDRVSRFWPQEQVLIDIHERGGEITPLYSRAAIAQPRTATEDADLPVSFHYERIALSLLMGGDATPIGRSLTYVMADIEKRYPIPFPTITPHGEHWSIEQVKQIIITAIVQHGKGAGMAVEARRASDDILELLVPTEQHRRMPEPCTCLSSMADDAYDPGGPMSGKPRPPACRVHQPEKSYKERQIDAHRKHSTGPAARLTNFD